MLRRWSVTTTLLFLVLTATMPAVALLCILLHLHAGVPLGWVGLLGLAAAALACAITLSVVSGTLSRSS